MVHVVRVADAKAGVNSGRLAWRWQVETECKRKHVRKAAAAAEVGDLVNTPSGELGRVLDRRGDTFQVRHFDGVPNHRTYAPHQLMVMETVPRPYQAADPPEQHASLLLKHDNLPDIGDTEHMVNYRTRKTDQWTLTRRSQDDNPPEHPRFVPKTVEEESADQEDDPWW